MTVRSAMATVKAEETRRRILEAALDLFREKGFEQTTMRDVAAAAGVAIGGAYYYFRSKQDLVLDFYRTTAEETRETLPPRLEKTRDLGKRIRLIIDLKLEQFADHRKFLGTLARSAASPQDPLSPFAPETRELRADAISWFRQAIEGSGEKIPRDLAPYLPTLLWLYQMAVIAYWLHDDSPRQRKTTRLIDATLEIILKLLRISRLPLMGSTRKTVVELLRTLGVEG